MLFLDPFVDLDQVDVFQGLASVDLECLKELPLTPGTGHFLQTPRGKQFLGSPAYRGPFEVELQSTVDIRRALIRALHYHHVQIIKVLRFDRKEPVNTRQ